jgi:hypothetical protein
MSHKLHVLSADALGPIVLAYQHIPDALVIAAINAKRERCE